MILEGYKLNLNDWIKSYDTINLKEDLRDETIFRAKLAKLKLDIELNSFKQQLLQNKTLKMNSEYDFSCSVAVCRSMESLLGRLKFEEVIYNIEITIDSSF